MDIQKSVQSNLQSWRSAVGTVAAGLLLGLGLHSVGEVRYIPSQSMTPTLQIDDRLIVNKLIYQLLPPQRDDIVVFNPSPELQSQNIHDVLIKRIIGVPGDMVMIRQGQVWINQVPLSEPFVVSKPNYSYGPARVPTDSYFVLGDNRTHSYDSHFWGYLPRHCLIGKAVLRFYPLNHFNLF